ncbi:MAG TPA: GTP cyclohydrolase I FolE [Planctomycetes bacterium]|jgi:GTP cyclohydrolase I|nr:GTP cyclohydrolase I FolE [Planctomycetota bacterium]HIK82309.1 GTP cyclohydrolase I FolE [Planctomycetota bacterium]
MAEFDSEKIREGVKLILEGVGEDPTREGLINTPDRVARMYNEMFSGLKESSSTLLDTVFHEEYDEIVLLKDIEFFSVCEHHLMPFSGKAHVAYLPGGKIVGLSKLVRAVEHFARRPQVQERLTAQIADLITQALEPKGVAVVLEATHTCMTLRGVRKPGSVMTTSAMRGVIRENLATRNEILGLIFGRVK